MIESIDINEICRIAKEAGDKILEVYHNEDFSQVVDFKADNSPLTLADKESHIVIDTALKQLNSDIPVLSEEGRDIAYEERSKWDLFWLVDPLDGTKEFIKRNGEFTVNIALIRNGEPVLGVIYAPVLETYYYGDKENGAFKKVGEGDTEKMVTKGRDENLVAVRSRSHASDEEQAVLDQFGVTEDISVGSSLKFCMVAEGKADVYYRHGPTMEWDTGAGQAVLEAAGGVVVDDKGPFRYNKESLLNGSFICFANPQYAEKGTIA